MPFIYGPPPEPPNMIANFAAEARRQSEPKRTAGRPSIFTEQLADLICERMANGESLRKICLDEEMPGRRTVTEWIENNADFRAKCARAREEQADYMADLVLEVANGSTGETAHADRVKVSAYQWLASKLAPKRYGDKLQVGGADDLAPVQISKIERVIVSVTDQRATLIEAQRSEAEQEDE